MDPMENLIGHQLADGNANTEDLFDTIKALLQAAWGDDWGVFTDDEPTGTDPDNIKLPAITFDVVDRRPNTQLGGVKPKMFNVIPDSENEGDTITLYRQFFDGVIRFDFWAKTNKECRALSGRFEDFMLAYIGHFKVSGISELVFLSEGIDLVSSEGRQDLVKRSLRYSVRIERITPVRSKKLKEVIEKVSLQNGL